MEAEYGARLIIKINEISTEFESRYDTDPSAASDYLRTAIWGLKWDEFKSAPELTRAKITELRFGLTKNKESYTPEQKGAILKTLGFLTERYHDMTFMDSIENERMMDRN